MNAQPAGTVKLFLSTFVDAAPARFGLNFSHLRSVSLHKNVAHKRLTRCCFIVVLDKITAAAAVCLLYLFSSGMCHDTQTWRIGGF